MEVGTRVVLCENGNTVVDGYPATVVYSSPGHSVRKYPCPTYALIQYDEKGLGWSPYNDHAAALIPSDAPHLKFQAGFYWVQPRFLEVCERYDDVFDVES